MIRTETLGLALIAGLFSTQGCNEAPVTVDKQAVETVSPITVPSSQNRKARDKGEGDALSLSVTSDAPKEVLAFDREDGALERKFARHGGLIEPEGIAFGPDGNLYVSSRSDEVLRYDGTKGKFIDVF